MNAYRSTSTKNLEFSAAEDIKGHNQAENGGNKVPHKADGRITEDQRLNTGGDDHGTADNDGAKDDGEGQAVTDIIQALLQSAEILMLEPYVQITLLHFLQDTLNGTRQITLQS